MDGEEGFRAPLLPSEGGSRPSRGLTRTLSAYDRLGLTDPGGEEGGGRRRGAAAVRRAGLLLLSALLVLGLVAVPLLLHAPKEGRPPACRKSAAIALAPAERVGNTSRAARLVVWSGMGHSQLVFADTFAFDLGSKRWRALRPAPRQAAGRSSLRRGGEEPPARWKAGVASLSHPAGLLVFGGDAPQRRGREVYEDDTWLLQLRPQLTWQPAQYGPAARPPSPRRAHTAVTYTDADGSEAMVVFGGRTADRSLLNDAWEARVAWPNVSWAPLAPPAGGPLPAPRKGHSAVVGGDGSGAPRMLVFGGRNESAYMGDIWALDPGTGAWEEVAQEGPVRPPPRDHHAAAYLDGRMFIFGGRSGATYETSQALGDLWFFDVATRRWQEVLKSGLRPLPRFLFSSTQYAPGGDGGGGGAGASRLLVFGGETVRQCKLNDVWELDLRSLLWQELSPPTFCKRHCDALFLSE